MLVNLLKITDEKRRTWRAWILLIQILSLVRGNPCPYQDTNTPCKCARYVLNGAMEECVEWVSGPHFKLANGQPIGLKSINIKTLNVDESQSNFAEQGYCKLKEPGQKRDIPLGFIAGRNVSETIGNLYSHPYYGLVGVNTKNHAKARFGDEGHYQNDYRQYVPECHCFIRIEEPTSNGWTRVLDDWTLWMGITHRGRFSIPPKYFWQYEFPPERDAFGWPILKLKTPRPPEKLMFQRHLDYRIVTLVNLTKNYPQGFKDFFWEDYHYLHQLSSKRSTDPNIHPQANWLKTGQLHGPDAVAPDYVHNILVAVMLYLADHASVSVECSMEIMNTPQLRISFGKKEGEQNTLYIPYQLSGYAQSWKSLGPVMMNKPHNGGRFACMFTPGVPRPSSVGPPYVWIHSAQKLKRMVPAPDHLVTTKQGIQVLFSTPQDKASEVADTPIIATEPSYTRINNYPAMWGDKCQEKRQTAKCHKRMVDIEIKLDMKTLFMIPTTISQFYPIIHNQ